MFPFNLAPARKAAARLCALALLLSSFGAAPRLFAQNPQAPAAQVDRSRLEVVEELSEALANDLLELSVATRDRDAAKTAEFFPERLEATPFPVRPLPVKNVVKWIGKRDWEATTPAVSAVNKTAPVSFRGDSAPADPKAARAFTREEFMRDFSAFLNHFEEIEDTRFKVKESSFDADAKAVLGAKVPTA
ncbi:MAG TPA: hypothetical protein VK422_13375, partial [Pyrinomonadaceae bacterium]|nr:hypothetical protein [Pyrinomonadaceae bacterium]